MEALHVKWSEVKWSEVKWSGAWSDGSWVKYVFSLMPPKNEWPFELGLIEQIPKILEDNLEHFQVFWETLFESERPKKSPET